MSNYYLCTYCKNCQELNVWNGEVDCDAGHEVAKVMVDHNGRDGKRYDEPTDVCSEFGRRANDSR